MVLILALALAPWSPQAKQGRLTSLTFGGPECTMDDTSLKHAAKLANLTSLDIGDGIQMTFGGQCDLALFLAGWYKYSRVGYKYSIFVSVILVA